MANEQNRTEAGGRKPLMNFTKEDKQMSKQPGYDREVVECYVMHLIELKGYDRKKMKRLGDADAVYVYEQRLDPEGIPEDVSGDTLYPVWNDYLDRYPERNTDMSVTWEWFYSLPEDYRIRVEDYWECEFSDDPPEEWEWMKPVDTESEDRFLFLDDVMMYHWLRKHIPEGERRDALEARRAAARRGKAKKRVVRGA